MLLLAGTVLARHRPGRVRRRGCVLRVLCRDDLRRELRRLRQQSGVSLQLGGQHLHAAAHVPVEHVHVHSFHCSGKACGAPDGCGGVCQSGTCGSGLHCSAGSCVCDSSSCTGCCSGGQCYAGTDPAECGKGGTSCASCGSPFLQRRGVRLGVRARHARQQPRGQPKAIASERHQRVLDATSAAAP